MSSNPHKEHTHEWYAFEAGRAAILDVEVKHLKIELQALRSSSFVTAVPSADYDKLVQENFDIAFDLREMERANARLKAEVERLRASSFVTAVPSEDYEKLKTEVERLEKDVWRMKMLNGIDEDTIKGLKAALKTAPEWEKVLEAIENNARLEAENRELQAEVERLRKAGDAMQKRLYVLENPIHPEVYLKLLSAWNAAKEGKPSV